MTDESETSRRHGRLERRLADGPRNSMWASWNREKSLLRLVYNYLLVVVARLVPSLRLRSWALRRLGVTVGDGVGWGLEATADVFFPERLTVEDDCIIGYDAVLLCHEYLQDEYRVGDIVVGERAMVGANATVLPGVEIGAGAQVAANSLVADDVPPETTVAGVPAEPVEREG